MYHVKVKKGKHHGHRRSSSSSSSSSGSDDEKKRYKKEMKKQKKLQKKMMKHGGVMVTTTTHQAGYPTQPYPTGVAPPPSNPYSVAGGPAAYPGGGTAHYPPGPAGYPAGGVPPAPGTGGAPAFTVPPAGMAGGYPAGHAAPPGQQPYPGGQPPVQYPGSQPYPGGVPPAQYPGSQPYPRSTGAPPAGQAGPFVAPSSVPGGQSGPFVAPPGVPASQTGPGAPPGGQTIYPNLPAAGQPTSYPGAGGPGAPLVSEFDKMKIYGTAEKAHGTVTPIQQFNAEQDAQTLRQAMRGMGTDEHSIIQLVSQRSNWQRVQITTMYKTMLGKDLIRDLESELSGDFRETIMALFMPAAFYDAWTLRDAMKGAGTDESVLIEVLCTRTNAQIREIIQNYKQHYGRDLERDIVSETSGHFKRLLVSCCQANRAELTEQQWQQVFQAGPESVIDRGLAQKDANELYMAGEKKLGTDESKFLSIMAIRHFYQLRATFEEYAKIAGRDIIKSIEREMSGDLCSAFKALVKSARNRPEYFADRLYKSMKGLGTHDSQLIRIIVSRSEIDLWNIKQVFQQKYAKALWQMVESDTSGDYRRLLVGIIGKN